MPQKLRATLTYMIQVFLKFVLCCIALVYVYYVIHPYQIPSATISLNEGPSSKHCTQLVFFLRVVVLYSQVPKGQKENSIFNALTSCCENVFKFAIIYSIQSM